MIETRKNLVDAYNKLDIADKRKELGKELTESSIMLYKLLTDITNINAIPNLDEFNNLYDSSMKESEYLTGFYEDFLNFKELLAIYLDKVISDKY